MGPDRYNELLAEGHDATSARLILQLEEKLELLEAQNALLAEINKEMEAALSYIEAAVAEACRPSLQTGCAVQAQRSW